MFARVNRNMMKVDEHAYCLDANYFKGLLAQQERTGVCEIYRSVEGGVQTEVARPIKARYGAVGHTDYVPKHKGESSGVMEKDGKKYRIRKLTPKECFRLQGWTDEYFERAQFVNSDSQLYKQAGNGVTVTVIQAIGEAMKEEDGW